MADRSWLRAGDDEVLGHLENELVRARDKRPCNALGIAAGADRDQVRGAFLDATKSYHPARFARRSDNIKKLAGEIFMLKKEAYDELIDKAPAPKPEPESEPARTPARSRRRPQARTARARSGPVRRASAPVRRASAPVRQPSAPVRQTPAAPKPPEPAPSPSPEPAASSEAGAPRVDVFQIPEFRRATTHCDRGEYREAKKLLKELRKRFPDSDTVAAHLHFANSGEHIERGRARHAIVELKRALSADPNFEPAKKALARLAANRLRGR